jgi:hypothetical protein
MSYKIELWGLEHVVIDASGLECGRYPSRAAAVRAIEDIGRQPPPVLPASESAGGKTRSTLYREANTPGTASNLLKRFLPRKGDIQRQTEHHYFRLGIWGGTDPAIVEKHHRESMSRLKRSAASMAANGAKQKLADERREKALALIAQGGKTRKEIAAALGMTDRGLRKLLRREK